MEGLGVHRFWGGSPAVDLRKAFWAASGGGAVDGAESEKDSGERGEDAEEDDCLNVLLLGAGDVRDVLKTAAACRRKGEGLRKVKIFMYDAPIECVARHLLLLSVLTDWERTLQFRANTFLEIFGNCMVQERTSAYIEELGQRLVRFVCDGEGSLKRLVDLSLLKFRETDALELVLKSWDRRVGFEMADLRDARQRQFYGTRYDSRVGSIDWDYQRGIKPQASIVHFKQYRRWRETGIAFEFGDQTYTQPNKSMASYAKGKEHGQSRARRGFWSDIQVGPYFSFGVDSETPNQFARDLFKVMNKGTATEQHRHTAVHVSVYNILSYLYEMETGKPYRMTKANDVYSGLGDTNPAESKAGHEAGPEGTAMSEGQDDQDPVTDEQRGFAMDCANSIMELKDRVTVVMLSGDEALDQVFGRKRFENLFDMAVLSSQHAHLVASPVIRATLRQRERRAPVVLVEKATNMVMLDAKQKQAFTDKLQQLAKQAGLGAAPSPSSYMGFTKLSVNDQ